MKTIRTHTNLGSSSIKKERSSIVKSNQTPKPEILIETHNASPNDDERFKVLVQYSSDIITVLDAEANITYQSPSITRILGYDPGELTGKNLFSSAMVHNEDISLHKKFIADTFKSTDAPVIATLRLRHRDESSHYFEAVGVNCLSNPIIRGIITTYRDITDRREIEKRKEDFITVASHELKTPISTIKTFAQILERRLRASKDKKNIYFIENINKHLDKLTFLVSDLLDVTRIESGMLIFHKKKFSLDDLVHRVIVDFQYTNDTHQIMKKGELGKRIYGDEDRIAQVLVNLINNAIKYSPRGGKIIVHTALVGNEASVGVQDFGSGIARKDQEKIFERFYRADTGNVVTGFGLGLYIAYEIVARHHGRIWVESKKGKGSTFYYTLPLNSRK